MVGAESTVSYAHVRAHELRAGVARLARLVRGRLPARDIRDVHAQMVAAAGDKDIRLLGGAATIRQYLEAGLVDEMHIAVSPRLLGDGEPLFAGLDLPRLGYRTNKATAGEKAVYYVINRG